MVFIIISGFVAILFVLNTEDSAEFLCDRYTYLDGKEHDDTAWDHCLARVRVFVWLIYIPYIFFQFHCLQVLIKHRLVHENLEIGDDESDV